MFASGRARRRVTWAVAAIAAVGVLVGSPVAHASVVAADALAGLPTATQSQTLAIAPTQVVFHATEGSSCDGAQTLTIAARLDGLTSSLTTDAAWLVVAGGTGQTPVVASLSAQCAGLTVGTHSAVVTATPTSGEVAAIPVLVVINPAIPVEVTTWKDGHAGAFSSTTDDGQLAGFAAEQAAGVKATFVMNGTEPPSGYDDLVAAGMEVGSHLANHTCYELTEDDLRSNIESNLAGLHMVAAADDVTSLAWPCGFQTPTEQVIAEIGSRPRCFLSWRA